MQSFGRRSGIEGSKLVSTVARDPNDHRFAPRKSSQLPALLTFEGAHEALACVIRDMSATGARVEFKIAYSENPFASRWSNVDRVQLVVRSDHMSYDCKIVRRSEPREIGVKFVAPPKQTPRTGR